MCASCFHGFFPPYTLTQDMYYMSYIITKKISVMQTLSVWNFHEITDDKNLKPSQQRRQKKRIAIEIEFVNQILFALLKLLCRRPPLSFSTRLGSTSLHVSIPSKSSSLKPPFLPPEPLTFLPYRLYPELSQTASHIHPRAPVYPIQTNPLGTCWPVSSCYRACPH